MDNPSGSKQAPASGTGGAPSREIAIKELETVVIRFAGDSGDGMQLTGTQFTNTSALAGNDLSTLPDFPAEIRAPAGTRAGVSGFQIQFGSTRVHTPGDMPDVLVAMNPAALMDNISRLGPGATVILNSDTFDKRALEKAGATSDPREDGTLSHFNVIEVPLTSTTHRALEETPLSHKERERCKNFFALGMMYWLYSRDMSHTLTWIATKFKKNPDFVDANTRALQAGYNFGVTCDLFPTTYHISHADIQPGTYRNVTGNQATVFGFVAASQLAELPLFLGSYPITPASDILHGLSNYKHYGVTTFQAEDEIAAVSAAIGASFGGSIGLTTSSGPGIALKAEAIGLAMMAELPLVIVDVQRGGPSTGLPTKTEQADLLQAFYGRNGESPVAVIAPSTPSDCFDMAIEAVRLATKYMTPVMYMSDGYLANGSEPWRLPDIENLPKIPVKFRTDPEDFQPYERDKTTLARDWVRPGTPGLEHRLGGLEKQDGTGSVSYDPNNHEFMIRLRAEKIARIAEDIPEAEVYGGMEGDLLLVGWGGTFGALRASVQKLRADGFKVSHMHLRHLNPMPKNTEEALRAFKTVAIAELNMGQLRSLIRDRFLIDAKGINKIQGQPFKVSEVIAQVIALIVGESNVN